MPRRKSHPELLDQIKQRRWVRSGGLWRVEVTGVGALTLRDEDDFDPLRHPDPKVRLENFHLAKQSPSLEQAVLHLVRRFEVLHNGWHADDQAIALAWTALYGCRTPLADVISIERGSDQQRVDFEAA